MEGCWGEEKVHVEDLFFPVWKIHALMPVVLFSPEECPFFQGMPTRIAPAWASPQKSAVTVGSM